MVWLEIKIESSEEAIEAIANILNEAGTNGVITGDKGEIIGYLPDDDLSGKKLEDIKVALNELSQFGLALTSPKIEIKTVNDEDWAASWKKYYHPVRVGRHIVIKPSWEGIEASPEDMVIELDPGMAFGTGLHPTTQMCLEVLEKRLRSGDSVIDVGTGSGILSIAAVKLSAGRVIALDIDPIAVAVAEENISRNQVAEKIRVKLGSLDEVQSKADIILANIIAETVIALARPASSLLLPEGRYISSGIIPAKENEVIESLERVGLRIDEIKRKEGWVTIVASKSEV